MSLQEWIKTSLQLLTMLGLGVIIGADWYRMHHEQPIIIQNHIPLCGNK